jgi:8-hydroxy-5-deazaflavin:NADPH oxidoreductase
VHEAYADIETQKKEARMPATPDFGRRRLLIVTGASLAAAALQPVATIAQGVDAGKVRIGVIGSGHIGGTIGGLWVKAGHPVLFSSRHPEELKDLVAGLGPLAKAGTVAEAVAFGDVLFVAVPYGALPQIGRDNAAAMKGKVVLDACNAVAARDGAIAEEVEHDGIGVTSQKYLPGTRVVRAFNTMSYMIFAREAHRADPKLAIPIAGDDADAVKVAGDLVREAGFDPVVVGQLADARRFQRGNPGYGQPVSAAELRQKLSLQP